MLRTRPFHRHLPRLPLLLLAASCAAAWAQPVNFPVTARPVASVAAFAPTLHVRLGPDSNACGITVPAGSNPAVQGTGVQGTSAKPRGKRRPLIVWLHGGMRSQNREKGIEAHRAMTLFVGPSDYYLCSPSAFSGQEWTRPEGINHIDTLIGYMLAHYPIDAKDINLVGVSDGCLGAVVYCLHGKYAINRRVLISSAPQLVLPAESLAGQARFATGSWDFLQGGKDRLFPPDQVIPYLKRWETLYPNAHLHYYPEGEHDFSYYAVKAPDLLKTIFSVEKGKQGKN